MPLTRVKTWTAGEVLTAADLNNEFNNLTNNVIAEPIALTQQFDANGQLIILDADGDTLLDASTDDVVDLTIAGADDFRFSANAFTALSGSSITLDSGNLTLTSGALTVTDGATSIADADSRTNSVATPLTITAETSGTPAAGIGTGIKFRAESQDEAPSEFGQVEFAATDIGTGTEDTYFQILTRVAGAALTATYRWIATGAFKAIFTHANSADRTYTLPNFDGTLGTLAGTESLTNKSFDNTNTFTACIKTGSLATSTGSASGDAFGSQDIIAMNDYSFSPNIQATGSTSTLAVYGANGADTSTTVGRFALLGSTNPDNYVVRWRYVTASDDPTIWILKRPDGTIKAVWSSDDPLPGGIPGIQSTGCESILLKSRDLESFSALSAKASEASALIRDRKLKMANQAYRALQLVTGDEAPAQWLYKNCELDSTTGLLRMKK